ncbi:MULTISPECIES: 3,4-dihydroxy-2-butanone-4-phosphate synthase [Rhodococcus]|uniref:3,4-dihydroxy-2-butanone-4-phosphate synthase n=1 Tax=Rhodococcus TaxID=1827 RepID=UPI000C99C888|nr:MULTISPECIES: 3,4-dihydroxy-2-butanone-4-phosphate synthase [Rhodococcus]PND51829.1 3,4-dihydroxy-2-butanone 4-phosphate synthase [Rhodococcus sp. ENV425]WKX00286.1 3,4-dihydroxy-2-butanone-4-phosphate synthase [Rhodococcus aetherivorans]
MTIVDEPHTTATEALVDLSPTGMHIHAIERVATAVAALARGGAILLCDDVDHPRRGDVVYSAARSSTELTAFAVRHTSGFLQVALEDTRCDQLGLVAQLGADDGAAQCVTVDAKDEIGTGISAADRGVTARLLASPHATVDSFTRPGHVVPLRARLSAPVRRFGFAECAVRLAAEAGSAAAAVMGTVVGVTEPIDMATGDEIVEFARTHALPLVGVTDVTTTAHPDRPTPTVPLHLPAGTAQLVCADSTGDEDGFVCLVIGEVTDRSAVPLRVIAAPRLLLEAGRDGTAPQILLGAMGHSPAEVLTQRARLAHAVQDPGSHVHTVLRRTGALSVSMTHVGF